MKWLQLSEVFLCIFFSSTVKSQQVRCDSSVEFQCQSGSCIDKKLVCDGGKDCADGADEAQSLCKHRSCSRRMDFSVEFRLIDIAEASTSFQCDYGGCINKLFVCNGLVNCVDGSDESPKYCKDMVCKEGKFRCSYGACIKKSDICNGRRNCIDGSDETKKLCWQTQCRKKFRCDYGACIKQRYVCNGRVDCDDESDEKPSICGEGHTYRPPILYSLLPSFTDNTEEPIAAQTTDLGTSPNVKPISNIFSSANLNPDDLTLLSTLLLTGTTSTKSILEVESTKKPKNNGFCNFHPNDEDASNILFCGDNRSDKTRKCFLKNKVPSSTIVLSECWGTTSEILVCQEDGRWLALNERNPTKSMDNLCQPSRLHSKICGRYPYLKQYRRSQMQKQNNKWPFLVGIFENIRFICTGTIITNQWILTAGHCFSNYRKSLFSVSDFGIQLSSSNGLENLNKLSAIYVCPKFGMDPLQNDLALLKLSESLNFSKSLFPACIDTEGDIIDQYAATFIRKQGENEFSWDLTRQNLDVSCFNRESECSRHLSIGKNQFCSKNSDDPVELKPKEIGVSDLEPGSSGGPFLVNKAGDNDDQWTVAGVVSYQLDTKGCPSYTVFSSLWEHRYWIEDCVNKGFCYRFLTN